MNATDSRPYITNDDEHYYDALPLPFVAILAFLAFMIILLTVLGNLLVLRFKARVGRTNTTLLVWNLGLTDFLVGVIVLPLAAVHLFKRKWIFGRTLCRIWVAADVTFCTCSVVTICIISVDRYLAVTRPLQYKSVVTKLKVVIVIILIWVFSSTILLTTVRWEQTDFLNQEICFAGNEIRYLAHSVVFAFFLPASVTLTLYWRIYKLARNRQKALDRGFLMILGHNMNFLTNTLSQTTALRVHIGRNNGMVEHQRRVLRTHERIAKTLGVVSCSFLFCWLPFFLLYLANYTCQGCVPTFAIDITSWLGYCNSMLNPIIYSFTVKEFKKSTIRTILPIWIFMHNMCPSRIKKPSENSGRTITRNIVSKTRPRKNRGYSHCNKNRIIKDHNKLLLNSINSSRVNYNVRRNQKYASERYTKTLYTPIYEDLDSTEKAKLIQFRNGIMRNSRSAEFERTTATKLDNTIVKSESIGNVFKTVGSIDDICNTTTMTSFMSRSKSKSTLSSSSMSIDQIIMHMPCKTNYKKRHSSPAIMGFTSSIFKRKYTKTESRGHTVQPILRHASQAYSWLLNGPRRLSEKRSNSSTANDLNGVDGKSSKMSLHFKDSTKCGTHIASNDDRFENSTTNYRSPAKRYVKDTITNASKMRSMYCHLNNEQVISKSLDYSDSNFNNNLESSHNTTKIKKISTPITNIKSSGHLKRSSLIHVYYTTQETDL